MNTKQHRKTRSIEETIKLGKEIGNKLRSHDVLALTGPLGAGKTTLIQGIAKGLKVKDYVASPSFTLINEYKGKIPLYHIDLYRLDNSDQIKDLGIDEYFDKEGVVVIEWAEKIHELLPENTQRINIEVIDENTRNIQRN